MWAEIDAAAMAPEEVALGRDLDDAVWRTAGPFSTGSPTGSSTASGRRSTARSTTRGPGSRTRTPSRRWPPCTPPASRWAWSATPAGTCAARSGCAASTGWSAPSRCPTSAGWRSPTPASSGAACRSLDLDPSRVLMVGDDPVADAGALDAGLADLVLVDAATPVTEEPRPRPAPRPGSARPVTASAHSHRSQCTGGPWKRLVATRRVIPPGQVVTRTSA